MMPSGESPASRSSSPKPSPTPECAQPTFKRRRHNRPVKRRRALLSELSSSPPPSPLSSPPPKRVSLASRLPPRPPPPVSAPPSQRPSALRRASRSRWDAQPAHVAPPPPDESSPSTRPAASASSSVATASVAAAAAPPSPDYDANIDRQWYLGPDDTDSTFLSSQDAPFSPTHPAAAARRARPINPAESAAHADAARWELRQLSSGLLASASAKHTSSTSSNAAATAAVPDAPPSDDAAPRVALLVQHLLPPFLRDAPSLSASPLPSRAPATSGIMLPVRDATSDMARLARLGSRLVDHFRQNRERNRPRARYWELGSHAGAKARDSDERAADRDASAAAVRHSADQPPSWKDDMRYSSAIAAADAAVSVSASKTLEVRTPTVAETRRSLPVFAVRRQLMNMIREHQVVVVVGETGSGKTTQLAQYFEEEGFARYGMIACTQPRRVAAVSVAQRVAQEFRNGSRLGDHVGYTIRFEDCTSERTCIKFMTDGILMRESLSDPELERYSVVIMDEAHERSLNTDVLFGILRTVLAIRRDLKVVITSATLNAQKFADFFTGAPIFNIPGRTFPVDNFFSRTPVEDYVDGAVWQAMQLHVQAPVPGDILIFMTGQEDIQATCETLADKVSKLDNPRPLLILPIYSQLAADLQTKIFEPAPEGARKVVVATNIAETSLTIDGIRYVIDSGFCKLKTYNPRLGMDALLLCPASQSSANQRAGRAGRTGPGKCYRLFTHSAFENELLETTVPEIQRTNLSHVVLLLKMLGVKDLMDFPFLDPPPRENILQSMHALWLLGAFSNDGDLTALGKSMSVFPLDPALSALVFMGETNGCLVEAVTIVAMLSVPNAFVRPAGREEESDSAREKFFVPESDHLTLLHVYQRWIACGCRADWCSKNFINNKSMRKAREVREQLLEIVRSQRMKESSTDDWDSIRRSIAFAFFYQAARRKGVGEYINVLSGVVCGLHPTSAMYGSGLSPDYVVYHELIMTKKEFMSCVTAVEPHWLAEAGPMLYVLKQAGDEGLELAAALQAKRKKIEDEIRSSEREATFLAK